MNDYKELIEELRKEPLKFARALLRFEAANAIEQLCVDVARLEAENRAKEQYIAETIGKVIKERDAAIADLRKTASCLVCKHFGENGITCDALNQCLYGEHDVWEWRGVREAEHGND